MTRSVVVSTPYLTVHQQSVIQMGGTLVVVARGSVVTQKIIVPVLDVKIIEM